VRRASSIDSLSTKTLETFEEGVSTLLQALFSSILRKTMKNSKLLTFIPQCLRVSTLPLGLPKMKSKNRKSGFVFLQQGYNKRVTPRHPAGGMRAVCVIRGPKYFKKVAARGFRVKGGA
jgi:hypothetical protein